VAAYIHGLSVIADSIVAIDELVEKRRRMHSGSLML
jgi:pyruvate-formate lyase